MKRILNALILLSLSSSLIAADMPQTQESGSLSRAMKTLDRKYNLYLKCLKRKCSEAEIKETQQDFITAIKAVFGAMAIVGVGYGAKQLWNMAHNFKVGDIVLYEKLEYYDGQKHKVKRTYKVIDLLKYGRIKIQWGPETYTVNAKEITPTLPGTKLDPESDSQID